MTLEIFARDPYIADFSARVVRNSGREIVLDRTAFYPGGSGQPSDKGELNVGPVSARIIEVRRTEPDDLEDDFDDPNDDEGTDDEDFIEASEPDIVHVLDRVLPKTVREVSATLDWPRRHRNMRFNTALALLSEAAGREFGASSGVGRIRSQHARLDLTEVSGSVDDGGVRTMETSVNQLILAGGKAPDTGMGGLYVKDTSEVGGISVTRWFDRGSRGIRLEFTLLENGETEVRR